MLKYALRTSALVLIPGAVLLTGCSVGPDYVTPSAPQVVSIQRVGAVEKGRTPRRYFQGQLVHRFPRSQAERTRGRGAAANQNLRAAVARVSEARAIARQTEAEFFPTLNFDATGERERTSPNNGQLVAQTPQASPGLPVATPGGTTIIGGSSGQARPYTFNSATVVPFDLSYEVDIWGRVRRAFEASGDQAQASLADYENVLLT